MARVANTGLSDPLTSSFEIQQPQQQEMMSADMNEDDYVPYTPLPDKYYDVTDGFEAAIACVALLGLNGFPTTSLLIQDQEVTLKRHGWCCTSKQKRPYAQIGSVDIYKMPCGCVRITSALTPPVSQQELEKNGPPGIKPGCCGCNVAMAESIVADLQERKRLRGGIGQILKLDYVLSKAAKLGTLAPMLVSNLGIGAEPKPMPVHYNRKFPVTEIDVTPCAAKLCGSSQMLVLGEEEAELRNTNCLGIAGRGRARREYGEMGFVEKEKTCGCCFSIKSDLNPVVKDAAMIPGCPCANRAKVSRVVSELRNRMAVRGQVGQIRKQEKILGMVAGIDESMRLVTSHMGSQFPPGQQEMEKRFGSNPPTLGEPVHPPDVLPTKTYDTTSNWDALCTCVGTFGVAGWTKEQVVLEADDMYVLTKNNIDDDNVKIPYAEMDSVDVQKTCCCCWSVNGQSPGWGCSAETVAQLAADLQERKEKRGNIAQLHQLRATQATAVGLNVMMDMAMEKEGLTIPTSVEERSRIWAGKLPRGLTTLNDPPHLEPTEEFGTVTYDITNYIGSCCVLVATLGTAGWRRSTLELDAEEMVHITTDFCTDSRSRTPYGNLGSVETEKVFCCCHALPEIASPGFGCSSGLVQQIAEQLQERKVKRGNIAQMKQQENIIVEVLKLEVKMDVLAHKKKLRYPPTQEVMSKVFAPAVVERAAPTITLA